MSLVVQLIDRQISARKHVGTEGADLEVSAVVDSGGVGASCLNKGTHGGGTTDGFRFRTVVRSGSSKGAVAQLIYSRDAGISADGEGAHGLSAAPGLREGAGGGCTDDFVASEECG